ncbi:SirB2 family protein [Dechloromonas sp. ZS-1]|uniref:SirB2 family protein n=1 Tax=Dechloromonas sp. ZS-1 TaxID=3138067 RepID=UPI0031FE20E2
MSYLAIKHLHVTCVILSGLGFAVRAWWMLQESLRLQHRLTRVLPHLIDSTLLASALTLAWMSGQYPFVQGWLTAKVLGLLVYIVCGSMALKRARSRAARGRWLLAALFAYAYIVLTALTRNPGLI